MNQQFDVKKAKRVAIELIRQTGQFLMDQWKENQTYTFKAQQDIVSQTDFAVEQLIIEGIKKNFPHHNILSEEKGWIEAEDHDYFWVIDPIDGTINYVHGAAPFRVGICLLKHGKPILSAVGNPVKSDIYFATADEPSTCNGQPIRVSSKVELNRAVVMTHLSSSTTARRQTLQALDMVFQKTLHLRMFGSGLSALSYVSTGKFDVFFNVKTHAWDILPAVLLVENAGGKITDLQGNPVNLKTTSVLATNGHLHDQMLELLAEAWSAPLKV
jgi:myo-inositol-1(or 4)-monophosphatase